MEHKNLTMDREEKKMLVPKQKMIRKFAKLAKWLSVHF